MFLPQTYEALADSEAGTAALLPLPEFAQGAAGIGHVAVEFDSDGAVRRVRPFSYVGREPTPHLALEVARHLGSTASLPTGADIGTATRIFPYHPAESYRAVSAADLLEGRVPAAFIKDSIVMVGATAQGLRDRYAVPDYAGHIGSGIAINANIVDALRHDRTIVPASPLLTSATAVMTVIILLLAFWRLEPVHAFRFAIVLWCSALAVAILLPIALNIWIPPGAALLAILVAYPLWAWRRLVSVVAYLQREASNLDGIEGIAHQAVAQGRHDPIEHQVHRLKSLVEAVRQRFDLVRTVINSAPEPIVVLDRSGSTVALNGAAEALLGTNSLGRSFPGLLASAQAELDLAGEEIVFPDERCFRQSRARLGEAEDERLGEIIQLHEITHMRQAERQRREMLEFLSHDMRSPQVAIIRLANEGGKALSLQERLDLIDREARRTLGLADDFVQLARLEQQAVELSAVELAGTVSQAVERARYPASQKETKIVDVLPDAPLFVLGDKSIIGRILDNLIGNAIRYCPQGSTIRLELVEDPASDMHARLTVADDGPGLPPDRQARPFVRFGRRSEDAGEGPSAGLGLAFVQDAVARLQGSIEVTSAAGQGTAFIIRLPLA